jgi:hypothetical protein|tara:strand:+ start:843 stop:1133 length:291 start_codon:yes stop_codon:yes gene_type:complete
MYKQNSPWSRTSIIEDTILDVLKKRFIFKDPYDEEYIIPQQFDERPDLCSYELYGTAKYWWIFAQRNPDIILDPIRGFTTGTVIKIPSKDNISKMV